MRKQIAAANWKMNLTMDQAIALTDELLKQNISLTNNQKAILGVPFPYLMPIKSIIKDSIFNITAQNCSDKKSGAYTGETSAEMLKSIDVNFVIIGHSERREYFNETHSMLADKVNISLENNLTPIFCCGEPLSIRENGTENIYVENQLHESLFHLSANQITNFIIAYEPIWAIGTGKTASSQQAQDMHLHIRNVFAAKYGSEVANTISILYGGSVKANNAQEIFSQPDVDGGLVGGASLVANEFGSIIEALKK